MARQRDYHKEYQQRQAKARREGYRSYGAKRRAKFKAKLKQIATVPSPRAQLEQQAVRQYTKHFGSLANPRRVSEHMTFLTDAALRKVAQSSADELRRRARKQPMVTTAGGTPLNPYWYH